MMNWTEYKQHLKEEWDFHKRHPHLLFLWVVYLISIIYAFTHDEAPR